MILDEDMSRQCNFIRENVVVADDTVVRHMTPDHQKVARSDPRRFSLAAGPVQRTKLANQVVVPDFEITLLAAELYVLRLAPDDGMLENPVSRAEFGKPLDDGIGGNFTIRTYRHFIFDDGKRSDLDALRELTVRADDRSRVNTHSVEVRAKNASEPGKAGLTVCN